MTQKYYHNDYKKMMGLDETRTASEKLLDKAIGGFKAVPELASRPAEKKVKEEAVSLSHAEVLGKLTKNIENSKSAVKVLKPLAILRKCLNDQAFTCSPQINTFEQWNALLGLLIEADDSLVGNYSEVGLVIDCLVEIFEQLLSSLRKLRGEGEALKEEHEK